jgi:hypothetical protein
MEIKPKNPDVKNTATIAQCKVVRDAFRRAGGQLHRTYTDKRVGYYRINTLVTKQAHARRLIKFYRAFGVQAKVEVNQRFFRVLVFTQASVAPPRYFRRLGGQS